MNVRNAQHVEKECNPMFVDDIDSRIEGVDNHSGKGCRIDFWGILVDIGPRQSLSKRERVRRKSVKTKESEMVRI